MTCNYVIKSSGLDRRRAVAQQVLDTDLESAAAIEHGTLVDSNLFRPGLERDVETFRIQPFEVCAREIVFISTRSYSSVQTGSRRGRELNGNAW